MFGYLVLLFTVLPALELYVLLKVGAVIGAGNTFLVIIVTGVVGAYLARLQGFFILRSVQENLNRGVMPTEEMIDGLMVLVGGIVLLTPGFITDAMGIMLLIPVTRAIIKAIFRSQFNRMITKGSIQSFNYQQDQYRSSETPDESDDIEDADFR